MEEYYYDSVLTGEELDAALAKVPQMEALLGETQTACAQAAASAAAAQQQSAQAGQSAAAAAEQAAAAGKAASGAETSSKNAAASAESARASAEAARSSAAGAAQSAAAAQKDAGTAAAQRAAADTAAETAQSASQSAAEDADRAEAAAKRAQSIAQGQKGYFETAAALKAAHGSGQNGDWAIVGETDTIWVWDGDAGAWADSGNQTDLSHYYTREQTDEKLQKRALSLYAAELAAAGWAGADETGWTQTVPCLPQDGGPAVTENTQLGIPMARPTGEREADAALQAALGAVNSGVVKSGVGTVTVKVWDKPETTIKVFWYGR